MSSVSSVLMIRPLMRTVASGFGTSAPGPRETAMGRKPMLATEAVISTGRRRRLQPVTAAT
jgi:hypothetical protein